MLSKLTTVKYGMTTEENIFSEYLFNLGLSYALYTKSLILACSQPFLETKPGLSLVDYLSIY